MAALALLATLFTAPCPPIGRAVSPNPPSITYPIYLPVVVTP